MLSSGVEVQRIHVHPNTAREVAVWRAGRKEAQGVYQECYEDGESVLVDGKKTFRKTASNGQILSIEWDDEAFCWKLCNDEEDLYINEEDTDFPPAENWQIGEGEGPAPTLSSDHYKHSSAPVCMAAKNLHLWKLNSRGAGIELKGTNPELSKFKGFYNRMSQYPKCLVSNIAMTPTEWSERTKGFYWVQRGRTEMSGDDYIIYAKCANQIRLGTRHRKNWNRVASNKYTPSEFDNITWSKDTRYTLQLPEVARDWNQHEIERFMCDPSIETNFRSKADIKRPMKEIEFMEKISGVSKQERDYIRMEYLKECGKEWQETFGLKELRQAMKDMVAIQETTPVKGFEFKKAGAVDEVMW